MAARVIQVIPKVLRVSDEYSDLYCNSLLNMAKLQLRTVKAVYGKESSQSTRGCAPHENLTHLKACVCCVAF